MNRWPQPACTGESAKIGVDMDPRWRFGLVGPLLPRRLTQSASEGLYEPVAPTSVHRRVSQDWG